MRKSLLLLLPFALVPLAGLMLPAAAESGEGSCVSQPAAEPIDLGAVPAKTVSGHLAISGISGDDECDDMRAVGKTVGARIGADEYGLAAEGTSEQVD